VFAVQDDIAAAITAALRVTFGGSSKGYMPKPDAHELLLKGRHHLFKVAPDALMLAGEYFARAVALDPEYAAAHAWLGFHYWILTSSAYVMPARDAMPLSRAAALRAAELDPSSTHAQAVLCAIAAQFDYDWPEAERRFTLATSGPAISPEAHRLCGFNYLLSAGRPLEAAHQCELAVRQDPLNSFAVMQWAVCLHAAGENRAAFDRYSQALELDDRNFLAHLNRGLWFLEAGRLDDAAAAANIACTIAPVNPWALACNAAARKLKGDEAGARDLLTRLGPAEKYGAAAGLCRYHMLVGDFEAAAAWAAQAIEQRDGAFPFALQFSCARGLRASTFWPSLSRMMNLS
jgi:Flp pilus assembly protein TadD